MAPDEEARRAGWEFRLVGLQTLGRAFYISGYFTANAPDLLEVLLCSKVAYPPFLFLVWCYWHKGIKFALRWQRKEYLLVACGVCFSSGCGEDQAAFITGNRERARRLGEKAGRGRGKEKGVGG